MIARLSFVKRLLGLSLLLLPLFALSLSLPRAWAAVPLPGNHRSVQVVPPRQAADEAYTVTVEVAPLNLIVNSGASARITATVVDTASMPLANVVLSGLLDPVGLGTISGLGSTNSNGQAFGTWTVGDLLGRGTLSVGDGTVTGTVSVATVVGALNTLVVSPSLVTVTVNHQQVFNVSGYDAYSNSLPVAPQWTTNGGVINADGVFTAGLTAQANRQVTATQNSIIGQATVNLVPDVPARLQVVPASTVISAGTSLAYTVFVYDAYDNLIGNVTSSTGFQISPAAGGSFVGNTLTPTVAQSYLVTGTYGALSATVTLNVTPAALNRLAIEHAPIGSGEPVSQALLSIYDTLTVYAAGYDRFDNLIGPVPAQWGATGILAGQIAPTTGISTVLDPAPILTGTGVINANYAGFNVSTGPITIQAPVLRIGKRVNPEFVKPGSELEYTIIYTNAGPVTAQSVVLTETYPAGTTYNLASPQPSSGNNIWSVGNVVPGGSAAIVVSLQVTDSMPVGSVLTNVVTMGAAKTAATMDTTTTPVVSAPLLDVTMTDNADPIRVGRALVYVIQYRNDGNSDAHNVRITETYPSGVTFENAIPAPTLTPTVGSHVWVLPELQHDSSGFIIVTVRVNSPLPDLTSLDNEVVLTSDEVPTPTMATESTLVQSPVLGLSIEPSETAPQANSVLTYTVHYINSGSTYASSVVITNVLPSNTVFQDCTPGCVYNPALRRVTWNLAQVESQADDVVTVTVNIANNLLNGTMLTTTAGMSATENVTAFASLTTAIASQPALNLSIDNGMTSAAADEVLTYTLSFANLGNAPAQSVVITDRIPAESAFRSCSHDCQAVGGGVYLFALGTISATASGSVTLSVKVDSPLPAGLRLITNTAAITTSTPGDSGQVATDVDTLSTIPELALTVDYDASTPTEGKTITYTLHYTNTSKMDTTGVVVSMTRSAFVTQSSSWPAALPLGNLPAGNSGVKVYTMTLPMTFTAEMASFMNDFFVSDDGPGGLPIASASTSAVVGVPDLIIEQVSFSPDTVTAGTRFTATLTIRNLGTGRACDPNSLHCAGTFYVDAFIDPPAPIPSFPFFDDGDAYEYVGPLAPGGSAVIVIKNLTFRADQAPILYFKVDNYACPNGDCAPSSGQRGLVPESNELNNVLGPVNVIQHKLYLPLVRK